MKSDLVDLEVQVHHETNAARLVSTDGEREKAVWVPKSESEFEQDRSVKSLGLIRRGTLTLPEWLAIEKGLV